jgi:VWFA-related protein
MREPGARSAVLRSFLLALAAALPPPAAALAADAGGRAAPPLTAAVALDYAPGSGARSALRVQVSVPVGEVTPNVHGFFNLGVQGEVRVSGRTYDRFGYRFDVPVTDAGANALPLALAFERQLRPGTYSLLLEVADLQSGRRTQLEQELLVPRLGATETADATVAAAEPTTAITMLPLPAPAPGPTSVLAASLPAVARGALDAPGTVSPPATAPDPPPAAAVRLVPPPRVVVGKQRFVAETGSHAVVKVEFLLDGRRVLSRARPPFEVELDLGEVATLRRLKVVAFDAAGALLGEDEAELNAGGADRFAVRLARPAPAAQRAGHVMARVEVTAPRGERVDRVELFLDEAKVAVLERPPYHRELSVADGQPAVLRAVAYLRDGHSAEASALLNAPNAGEIDVDLVELYATVVDPRGRPVRGLSREKFRVSEEGQPQSLERFAEVRDLPVNVVLLLDTSGSMTHRLEEVRAAALAFLQATVTPRDRVSLVTFDSASRTRVDFTNDLAFLANGLEGLTAGGGTALHDSLVFALDELAAIPGQRVLVLLSDGVDERSAATPTDVLELARRSATTIYTIGLDGDGSFAPPLDRQLLDRLAEETGGASFNARGPGGLRHAYDEIEEEMRSRYLLAYYSSHAGDRVSFRLIDVEVTEPRLSARTIRGYYP